MKNLVALFCSVSAFAAFAADSDILFGALRVDSTATQTIVSIPWAEAGTGGDIKVKDAIKTTNLTKGKDVDGTDGDQLYLYSNGSYKLWQLNNEGIWKGATVVGESSFTVEAGLDTDTLKRGDALILVRKDATKPFYLYGQYTADAAEVNLATPSEGGGVAYSLIAPPKTVAESEGNILLSSAEWTNIETTDNIVLPSGQVLNWNGETWGVKKFSGLHDWEGTWDTSAAKIPMGQGVWFMSFKGSQAEKKVKWF